MDLLHWPEDAPSFRVLESFDVAESPIKHPTNVAIFLSYLFTEQTALRVCTANSRKWREVSYIIDALRFVKRRERSLHNNRLGKERKAGLPSK